MMHDATAIAALEEDARARRRALDPESFIVQAPAGSGKTELLTQRFLALLARVEHPEEVIALTFTNRAAGEMRGRILSSLEMAATRERPGDALPHRQVTYGLACAVLERDRAHGWDLAGHPGRLRILTIDALCGSLVRQMPFLSRFGNQPRVEPDAMAHYRLAARETLSLAEGDGADALCVRRALHYFRNDTGTLGALLAEMLARRDQWHREDGQVGHAPSRARDGLACLVSGFLEEAAGHVDARMQELIMPAARHAAENSPGLGALLHWHRPLAGQCSELAAWQALASLLLTGKGQWRRSLDRADGFPAGHPQTRSLRDGLLELIAKLPPGAAACLHGLRTLPHPDAVGDDRELVETVERLLALAEAQLWLVFRDAGVVDFTAVAQHALAALGTEGEPTDLALALDYRIRHLLVDEFQDTSPGQVALAAALTRGWEPGDGRTLFVVGDPMQSIYRFRKAEVGLFLDVAHRGIGGIALEHLRLHRNNRSDPVIVDWVNSIFPSVFPERPDARAGAVPYASCSTDRPPCGHAQVTVHPFSAAGAPDAPGSAEAARIIDIIDATRFTRPEAGIAVLVRARSHLAGLVAAIRQMRPDLAYQAVEMESLSDRQLIQDLLSLTHALSHRADRVHWLAVLRAPWCGLTLDDLHRLAGDDHDSTVWELMHDGERCARLSQDGRERLKHVREVLQEAFASRGRQAPTRWISQVWQQLGGARCLHGAADLQDADAFFALLGQCTRAGSLDAELLAERIGALFSSPNPDAAARGIQLMTIHRSKGLEFDCVIVPGLGQVPRPPDRRLLLWERVDVPAAGPCVIPAVMPFGDGGDGAEAGAVAGGVHALLQEMEARRERYEAQRLLYVAVTRARHTLHLLGTLGSREGVPEPARGSLLELLWRSPAKAAFLQAAAATVPEQTPGAAAARNAGPSGFSAPLVRLRSPVIAGLAGLRGQAPAGTAAATVAEPDGDSPGMSLDAATGTLVHRYLEMIANDGLDAWSVTRCAQLEPACQAWLHGQGFAHRPAAEGARRTLQALRTVLGSGTGRWILGEHDEAHAEKPLTSRLPDGAGQANHIVDRTFVSGGERWIIDYKTVRCEETQPRAFLEAHARDHFREQLERYAGLFAGGGLPVRTAIFYVLQDELVELERGRTHEPGSCD